tara:strand:+ start:618 stop:1118 length:501 start_codon:yes stop_codon:yes gene_type:complete
MKKILLVLVLGLGLAVNAQTDPISRIDLGMGATQDGAILLTMDHVGDNKIVSGFLIGMKGYNDSYKVNVPYLFTEVIEKSDLLLAVRLGYEINPKVSLISSLGVDIHKIIVSKNQPSMFGGYLPMSINSTSKMYSALELNIKLVDSISVSAGYGTRGIQATLNFSI